MNRLFRVASLTLKTPVPRGLSVCRLCSSSPNDQTEGEKHVEGVLKTKFPQARNVSVRDISGGCGSMYEVYIESMEFKGLRVVKQHQIVTKALEEEIKAMHGLRINTAVPENTES